MNYVSQLYDQHPNADIYVVGTGASLRVFPISFLENKITIGLNQAWKILPVKYCITIRPELNIPEFVSNERRDEIVWITKFSKFTNDEQRRFAADNGHRFYYFDFVPSQNTERLWPGQASLVGRNLQWVRRSTENFLYLWSSISQAAVNLAANMGARNIILVGCDNAPLLNNHHAHNQHTMWADNDPRVRYGQYYEGLKEIRAALRERQVTLLSATPFLRIGSCDEEFTALCHELNQPAFVENADISVKIGVSKLPPKRGVKRLLSSLLQRRQTQNSPARSARLG